MTTGGKLGAVLKVVLRDVDNKTLELVPGKPSRAYLVGQNFSTSAGSIVGSYPSDTPGAIFIVSSPSPSAEIIAEGLTAKKITIAFARAGGRSDIRVELDLTVIETDASGNRTRSSKAVDEFLACFSALKLG